MATKKANANGMHEADFIASVTTNDKTPTHTHTHTHTPKQKDSDAQMSCQFLGRLQFPNEQFKAISRYFWQYAAPAPHWHPVTRPRLTLLFAMAWMAFAQASEHEEGLSALEGLQSTTYGVSRLLQMLLYRQSTIICSQSDPSWPATA